VSARNLAREVLAGIVLAIGGTLLRAVLVRIWPAERRAISAPEQQRARQVTAARRQRGSGAPAASEPLNTDLLETEGLLEWAPDHGEFHLPAPSIWPVVLAAGLTLAAFGITTFWVFSAFGLLLFVIATAGWVAEVRRG
jgi:hypothetical protein